MVCPECTTGKIGRSGQPRILAPPGRGYPAPSSGRKGGGGRGEGVERGRREGVEGGVSVYVSSYAREMECAGQ